MSFDSPGTKEALAQRPTSMPTGSFPYGWKAVPALTPLGKTMLHPDLDAYYSFPDRYVKQFTHNPKTIILGAVKRTGGKSVRYIVWHDRSLRRVDKVLRKQFDGMTPDAKRNFIGQALKEAA